MSRPKAVLGISAYYHDSAAALLLDGEIVAAAQEERFTRLKQDPSFPTNAVQYVLSEAGLKLEDVMSVSFYDKPYIKFERLLETYHAFAPKGLWNFATAIPVWIKEKLFMKRLLKEELAKIGILRCPLLFPEHHLSHAASAFFPSPFEEAAILTIDGVGEWATTTIGLGKDSSIKILRELRFPHSVGLLYSAFTFYCGFKVNSGEYKLMGLAPYGCPGPQVNKYKEKILSQIVDIRSDGSILLNMAYFDYATGFTMCKNTAWQKLFDIPPRKQEDELTQPYMDLALAIQEITEKIVLKLAATAKTLTGSEHITLAGGVALNCVANGKLLRAGTFKDMWIQPAAGDAGGALGAALAAWHIGQNMPRKVNGKDSMKGSYLGPSFADNDVLRMTRKTGAVATYYKNFQEVCHLAAQHLDQGSVVGWFQGRMEFGPRALGNRSILGDARNADMQKRMNLKIKYREGFRPFAPSVAEQDIGAFFDLDCPSPYMLLVAPVKESRRKPLPPNYAKTSLMERLYHVRSDVPAITHVDFSARVQSVNQGTNERYWQLIDAFKKLTGYGLIVNTSFNVRGEPIVCTPLDAYKCFMRTEMDLLIVGNYVFEKGNQAEWVDGESWATKFTLD